MADCEKVLAWSRYGCNLDDVCVVEVCKAAFEVLLGYVEGKAMYKVIYREYSLLSIVSGNT